MAFAVGKSGGPRVDINVTPLVDVVLVMLIIFMVLSPAASYETPNAIPRAAEIDKSNILTSEQLSVELRSDGSIAFKGKPTTRSELPGQLKIALEKRVNRTVFFVVHDSREYGEVVYWMAVARQAGASTVALQISPPKTAGEADNEK